MTRSQTTPPARPLRELQPAGLVQLCIEHDPAGWDELVRRYANLIYSTILRVGVPPADQEDAFQDTVMTIYRGLSGLRRPESLTSWIIGIAYRQGVDRIRALSRRKETSIQEMADPDEIEGLPAPELSEGEEALLERSQRLQEALAGLRPRCRQLMEILFYEEPCPEYAEVARRLGLPIGSLGPTRARCIEKLRRYYEDRGWGS